MPPRPQSHEAKETKKHQEMRNETDDAKAGPLKVTVKEKQAVNVPARAGVAATAAGVVLLLAPAKR